MANRFGGVVYVEISKVAVAPPWLAIVQSRHGPAVAGHCPKRWYIQKSPKSMAMAGHGGAMVTLEIPKYTTPPNRLAMATFDHGQPWRGHGNFGDF